MDDLAAYNARYLNQAKNYGMASVGSGSNAIGNTIGTDSGLAGLAAGGVTGGLTYGAASGVAPGLLGEASAGSIAGSAAAPAAAAAMLGLDTLQGKDTTAQTTQSLIDTGLYGTGAAAQGQNALLEGLLKLNIGGKSIANTAAGEQLSKALAYTSDSQNAALKGTQDIAKDWTGGIGGLTKDGLSDLSKGNVANLARNIMGAGGVTSGARVANNVGSAVSNAVNKVTGGGIKISDEDLKTNIDYDRKHIDDFLNKLKPAKYDYKDEVKDSPFASDEPQLGVMAQDLEKSELGEESVIDTEEGKAVDYDDLQPKMLAALAQLKSDIDELKKKK